MGERSSYGSGTFCWFELSTPDPAGAKAFYSGLLGWSYDDRPAGPGRVYTMCRLRDRDVAALQEAMAADQPPAWLNYVAVEDAAASAARARELGGTVLMDAFDVMDAGRMALLADPGGAVFAVWQAGRTIGATLVNEPGAVAWNDLRTTDVEGARDFYGGLFGWRLEDPGSGGRYFTIYTEHGMNGGVMPGAAAGVPPRWVPYFAVTDLDAALATAQDLGARLMTGPMDVPSGRFADLADPQGAAFSLLTGELDP